MAERLTNTLEETPTKGFGLKFCSDRNCNSDEDCCNCYAFNETINKLRQLEDIMDKYDIESVEELGYLLEVFKKMRKQYGKLNQENCKSKKQLNTWKRACELACKKEPFHCPNPPERYNAQDEYGSDEPYWIEEGGCEFDDPAMCLECEVNYYYQQAKKEGEQK